MLCMLACCRAGVLIGPQGPFGSLLRVPSPTQRACMQHQRMLQLRPDAGGMLEQYVPCSSWCVHPSARNTLVRGRAGRGQMKVGDDAEVMPPGFRAP